jgi:hypothetical protein
MPAHTFARAWSEYQEAVVSLYAAPLSAPAAERGGEVVSITPAESQGDAVVASSESVRVALTTAMATPDSSRRELAGLKLVAAASQDLTVAFDLLTRAESPGMTADRSARTTFQGAAELQRVLDAPLELGMLSLIEGKERAALSAQPASARDQLLGRIDEVLKQIPERVVHVSTLAVAGLGTIGAPLHDVASVGAQEILAQLPAGLSALVRWAARLVVEAVRKLQAALGSAEHAEERKQILEWWGELTRDLPGFLLEKLYETPRIAAETKQLVTPPETTPAQRYHQAVGELEALLGGYGTTTNVLDWTLRILAYVKGPVAAAGPWGALAVGGSYLGVLAYALYSGGDYLDWYRLGDQTWLDRVKGLRTCVHDAMTPPPG